MENIIEPNDSFDFTKLSLAHPVGIQGGAYFTKIENNGKPLYIQTNKSQTRQGIVKTGKKYYCDLMFDKNAATLINWFEMLEENCQKLIYEKRNTWFENNLDVNDIETAFNSPIRVYKSGKYYLIRTNVKNHNNSPYIKIYNEHEIPLTCEDIRDDTNMISILEIVGIKFTSRNFQIEIDLKQVMVLDNEPLFENCLIKAVNKQVVETKTQITHEKNKKTEEEQNLQEAESLPDIQQREKLSDIQETENLSDIQETENLPDIQETEILPDTQPLDIITDTQIITDNPNKTTNNENLYLDKNVNPMSLGEMTSNEIKDSPEISTDTDNISIDLEFERLDDNIEENRDELKEIKNLEFDNDDSLEIMHLKKPNQVYFELYTAARNKAKLAKKNALMAYLEAKNIKKTYMLDDIYDSDSDIDEEIDNVSESDL